LSQTSAVFALVPDILQWIAVLSVIAVIAVNLYVSRSRASIVICTGWLVIGLVFIWLLPSQQSEGARIACYLFDAFIALMSIRMVLVPRSKEHAFDANRKLINALFGERAARGFTSSIERMRKREREAKERGVTVVDILKEEHGKRSV
jgi:hypothetical protein